MTSSLERPPPLLHNIGGPSRASIAWRGLGRAHASDDQDHIRVAATQGTWLLASLTVGQAQKHYHRHWNTAAALLALVEPDHGLDEPAATRRLKERIEAHARELGWPACLVTMPRKPLPQPAVTVGDALLTFAAMAKSTGSLWLRDRPAHLAPLHAPRLIEPSSTPIRGVVWDQYLWFPEGIPRSLLEQAAQQLEERARPTPEARASRTAR